MRLIAISDTHGNLPEIPQGDVLCIAGDISPLKYQRNLPSMVPWLAKRFATWADKLPVEKVVLVAGNHDFVFQSPEYRDAAIAAVTSLGKVVYLENSTYEHNGKLFYGSPWVIGPAGWAFYDETKQLEMIEETMPEGVDVAIFHQPLEYGGNGRVLQVPSWMIGQTFDSSFLTDDHLHPSYGSTALDNIVEKKAPKLVVTGHVHSGNHEIVSLNDTMVANVSLLDEDYKLKYRAFELNI